MKTAVVPSVHTRRDTISSSRRRWRCSGGCSTELPPVHLPVLLLATSPANSSILHRAPLLSASRFNSLRDTVPPHV